MCYTCISNERKFYKRDVACELVVVMLARKRPAWLGAGYQ